MIKRLLVGVAAACTLAAACCAFATVPIVTAPAGTMVPSTAVTFGAQSSSATFVDGGHPLPVGTTIVASTATAQTGTVTSSAATPSSGTAAFAGGVGTVGPLTPQLGRPVRVVLTGTWSGTFVVGTSVNNCTTVNSLTIGGLSWGSFTGNANEDVDVPMISGVTYCGVATVTSGTLNYAVRQ